MLVRRVWPSRPTFDSSFSDFDQIRREMLRLLDAASGDTSADAGAGVFPPMNISQDDDNFYLRAEVPGHQAGRALDLRAPEPRLDLRQARDSQREHERVSYHRKERPEGAFDRAVTLPTEVDAERVEARYADGILTLDAAEGGAGEATADHGEDMNTRHATTTGGKQWPREARTEVQKPETTSVRDHPRADAHRAGLLPAVDIFENDNSITSWRTCRA